MRYIVFSIDSSNEQLAIDVCEGPNETDVLAVAERGRPTFQFAGTHSVWTPRAFRKMVADKESLKKALEAANKDMECWKKAEQINPLDLLKPMTI